MTGTIITPPWLAGPSEQRLRDISNVIASRVPRSPEYAISIVQDAIALRGLAISFVRYANIYASPILRLSPEIISEILSYVAELEPTKPTTLGWIRLGHVSHAFRSALLDMHALWAGAACHVDAHARGEVLTRAGNTPLSIRFKDDNEDIEAHRVQFAMDSISFARYMRIEEHDPKNVLWTHEPRAVSGRELPLLEYLKVEAIHRPKRDASWLSTDIYEIQPVRAPRLKCVVLVNIFVPFPPGNLTKLILKRPVLGFAEAVHQP
ncbi:hypothetical protein PENSPDRAFT_697029 [Peniophora sp. CONT]|nr:hypothetical protein PENSPDRAFT_697029 [Peniophora sp. CONT]